MCPDINWYLSPFGGNHSIGCAAVLLFPEFFGGTQILASTTCLFITKFCKQNTIKDDAIMIYADIAH